MQKQYMQVFPDYELDNITTRVYVKKGGFVDQSVIRRIIKAIEEE